MVSSFIKTSTTVFFTFFLSYGCIGQTGDLFNAWPDTVLAKANSAKDVSYMSLEEKKVIYYINLCRINPTVFSQTTLRDYIKSNDIKKDKYVKELIRTLESTSSKKILQPSEILTNLARAHAKDMGETGRTGHNSSDGTVYKDRMKRVSTIYAGLNENASYGNELGIDIVIDLLIDRNVPSAGHRKNILNTDSRFVGVAIEPHKRWGVNCVQDFGGKKIGN